MKLLKKLKDTEESEFKIERTVNVIVTFMEEEFEDLSVEEALAVINKRIQERE